MEKSLTRRELEAKREALLDETKAQIQAGDDSALRALIKDRFVAECLASGPDHHGSHKTMGRSRKFFDPLFMTPAGLLHAFPALDEHLFIDLDQALSAIAKYGKTEHAGLWSIRGTKLGKKCATSRAGVLRLLDRSSSAAERLMSR